MKIICLVMFTVLVYPNWVDAQFVSGSLQKIELGDTIYRRGNETFWGFNFHGHNALFTGLRSGYNMAFIESSGYGDGVNHFYSQSYPI